MNRKNKKRKSLIPLKLQVPLTIILGAVFIFLLTARLRDGRTDGAALSHAANDEPSSGETTVMGSSQRRIDSLIAKISGKDEGNGDATEEEIPELPSDPFVEAETTAGRRMLNKLGQLPREFRSQQRGGEDSDSEYERRSREEFIESLALQATLRDGNTGIALINGKLYAENQSVGRLKLVKVGERVAFLADSAGSVLLKMKGDDEL